VEVASDQFQFVDERVSRIKYERQVENFEKLESNYRREGVVALNIEFPYFDFAFIGKETFLQIPNPSIAPNQLMYFRRPVPFYLFSIRIDYTNYDTVPPSINIINPFTLNKDKNIAFVPYIAPDQQNKSSLIDEKFKSINQNVLLQDNKKDLFFCLRGIKEYHEHPQHNGDSWFLYRTAGKGNIVTILDQLQLYSIANFNKLASQQLKLEFNNG